MKKDILFIKTVDDLAHKLASEDAYDYIKAAGLLRTLILDGGNSLINRVNRIEDRRVTLEFSYGTLSSQLRIFKQMNAPPDQMFILDGFSPKFQICLTSTKSSGLDEMLKETIMLVDGIELSVKDTVKYIANVGGGVHIGEPKTEKEITISKIAASIGDATVYQRTIKGIAQVVIDGLNPLYDKCNAQQENQNGLA